MPSDPPRPTDDATPRAAGQKPAEDRGPFALLDPIDTALAAALIAICGYFYALSLDFPAPSAFLGENVLPGEFPRILLGTIAILALAMPFEHLFELERWPLIKKSREAPIGGITVATIVFLILLLAAAPYAGTMLMIFFASAGLPILWGERRWLMLLTYSVLFTAVVTYVFSIVLSVYFEPGVLNLTLR